MARSSTLLLPVVSNNWQHQKVDHDDTDSNHHPFLVQAAVNSNTFAIHGRSVEKELTELGKEMGWNGWIFYIYQTRIDASI